MLCTNCSEEIDNGASFCGNCGQPTHDTRLGHSIELPKPEYSLVKPIKHKGEVRALLSVVFGVIGVPASLVPIAGLGLGLTGLILGTTCRRSRHKLMSTVGIVASTIAVLVSLGVWGYAYTKQNELDKTNKSSSNNTAIIATSRVETPCFNIQFPFTLNTDHDENDKCDVRVFEGRTMEESNDIYKVYSNKVPSINEANFADTAKEALEKDIQSTLSGFKITGQRVATFAGSPAYIINASSGDQSNISVVEAAVLHKGQDGYNLFSIVHAAKGDTTDLRDLEDAWSWK